VPKQQTSKFVTGVLVPDASAAVLLSHALAAALAAATLLVPTLPAASRSRHLATTTTGIAAWIAPSGSPRPGSAILGPPNSWLASY